MSQAKINYRNSALIGILASAFLTALVIIVSEGLENFNSALFGCTVASIVAFGAVFSIRAPASASGARAYFRCGPKPFFQC